MAGHIQVRILDIRPIVKFLEETLECTVDLKPNGDISTVIRWGDVLSAPTRKTALMYGLGHYLRYELGRHWAEVWEYLEQTPPCFSKEETKTIETAIRYYEQLDKIGAASAIDFGDEENK